MVRKNDILKFINSNSYVPCTDIELYHNMELFGTSIKHFTECLEELSREHKIVFTKKNRIMTPLSLGQYIGELDVSRKGFGFVKSQDGTFKDLYISKDNLNGARHGDIVLANKIEHKPSYYKQNEGMKEEGRVEKILKYNTQRVIGVLEAHGSYGFVKSDDKKHLSSDIFISCGNFNGAQHNDKVVCEIIRNSTKDNKPEGTITKVICNKDDRFADILSVIESYELPESFPDKVLKEAEFYGDVVKEEDMKGRLDLRDELIFTIDGPYAKDLDDAISIKRLDNGNFELGVHIADVTHYVKEKSKLDKEALKRGTSVYLVDKVIPMLPPKLSNGLCSLHPYVERLTLSVIMEIDNNGLIVKHDIKESVIVSKHRLTYDEVKKLLVDDRRRFLLGLEQSKYYPQSLIDKLFLCETLALILRKKRMKRGALDLNLPEADIRLNSEGEVQAIGIEDRNIANVVIEEFMLAANETVAEQFLWLEYPFVFRVHETPDGEKMYEFNRILETFGYKLKGDLENIHPKTLQKLLNKLKDKPEGQALSNYMLRSFNHAKYSPDSLGHFGLSANYYTHFTSPIRRYPDLQIHRIIKEFLNGKLKGRRIEQLTNIVEYASKQSSDRERIAEKAERDVVKVYTSKFMEQFIGCEFEGVVTSLTKIGMYVQIRDIIEGMVRIDDIPGDTFGFDETKFVVKGMNSDKTYKLGQSVNIKVSNVDTQLHEITFEIVEE